MRFTTQSGSIYLYDETAKRLSRLNEHPVINTLTIVFEKAEPVRPIVIGQSAAFAVIAARLGKSYDEDAILNTSVVNTID